MSETQRDPFESLKNMPKNSDGPKNTPEITKSRELSQDPKWTILKVLSGDNLWKIANDPVVKNHFDAQGYKGIGTDERADMLAQLNNKSPLSTDASGNLKPYIIMPWESIKLPMNPLNSIK